MPSRLAVAYQRRNMLLALAAARSIGRQWGQGTADGFVRAAVEIDAGAREQAVALADAYMAATVGAEPLGLDPAQMGRKVDPEELWSRPAKHARMAGSGSAGLAYAQQAARTNVLMAARDAWHAWSSTDPRIVGYKRVLGGGKNCGLCIVASTQRYRSGDLSPIHSACSCTVDPIIGQSDPGHVLDSDRLEVVKGSLSEDEYADTWGALRRSEFDIEDLPPVQIRTHGELGSVLTDARHDFTGPQDLAA